MMNRHAGSRNQFFLRALYLGVIGFSLLFCPSRSNAQVNAVYNQFFLNPYLYNPAYAGVEGHSVVYALYKQQWSNISGAPTIINANFHTPLKGGIGLGVMVYNETFGPFETSWGKVSSSYLLTIDKEHYLRFGLSLGGGTNSFNFNDNDSPADPAILNLVPDNTFFLGDFGATYHFGHFNVGISIPNLVSYEAFSAESISPVQISPLDNILAKMNYRGHISDEVAIEPHILYRYNDAGPSLIEGSVIFHIKHIIWAGGSYRQDNNFIGLFGLKIKESFALGYSYELGNSSISSTLGPTHEIHVGYHLGTKKKHAKHAHSFIKSHPLSPEERAKKRELEREKKLAALRETRPSDAASGDDDALSIIPTAPVQAETSETPPASRTNDLGEQEKALTLDKTLADGTVAPITTWVPADSPDEVWSLDENAEHRERTALDGSKEVAVELIRTDGAGNKQKVVKWEPVVPVAIAPVAAIEEEQVSEDEPVLDEEPVAIVEEPVRIDPELTQDFRSIEEIVNSDEPLVVTRGSHLLELPAGNYVIAGAFEVFDHAEDYSDDLFQRGFHDTIVGYVSARGYYYVVVFQSPNIGNAVTERNKIRRIDDLSEVWVLKVNE